MDTKHLRQKILDMAIRGQLVAQEPTDESATELLARIRAEKEALAKSGKIKKTKKTTDSTDVSEPPFEVPEGWVWTTIEEICSKIGSGSTPRGSNYSESGIPFFRSQNVYNDGLVYDDIKFITDEIHQSMIGTEVVANDLLLNITGGSLGRCAIVPKDFEKGNVSQHVCILRTVLVLPEYLHAFVLSSVFSKTMKISGSGREGLPKYNLEKMAFPLPPLSEQVRIVGAIEKWFGLVEQIEAGQGQLKRDIAEAKAQILQLAITGQLLPQNPSDLPAKDSLLAVNPKAVVVEEGPRGWCRCKLGEVAETIFAGGDKPERLSKIKTSDLNIPIYSNGIENDGLYGFTDVARVNKKAITISARGTIGFTCLRNEPFTPIIRLITIIPHRNINHSYLRYAIMKSIDVSEGSSIPQLTVPTVKDQIIPLPPLTEQERIVAKIEEMFGALERMESCAR